MHVISMIPLDINGIIAYGGYLEEKTITKVYQIPLYFHVLTFSFRFHFSLSLSIFFSSFSLFPPHLHLNISFIHSFLIPLLLYFENGVKENGQCCNQLDFRVCNHLQGSVVRSSVPSLLQ